MLAEALRVLLSVVFYTGLALLAGCSRPSETARPIPDFSLTAVTVDGSSPFDRRALLGRAWVADFVFTRCSGPCPMLSARMRGLQKRLPASVGLLSFTVDPDHDSPEVLTAYARRFGADPRRWFFLAGEKPELARLFKDAFLLAVVEDPAAPPGQNVAHSTKFVLIDADARVRGWYDGEDDADLDRLAADAKRL